MKITMLLTLFLVGAIIAVGADKKPITNVDVIKMVKAELPEATVLLAIQANPHEFDTSVDALLDLKTAGVPTKVIDAMIAPVAAEATPTPTPTQNVSIPVGQTESRQNAETTHPHVFVVDPQGRKKSFDYSSFKILSTKAKGASVGALVADGAVTGISEAVVTTATATALQSATGYFHVVPGADKLVGSIGKKLFKTDEVTKTFVCALAGREAMTSFARDEHPRFEIHFDNVPGGDPDEYQPVIIKVAVTPKNWRMLGAFKAKSGDFGESATGSDFSVIEDRVPVDAVKLARGIYVVSPSAALEAGEYALALRPNASPKKVILHEFEVELGEGIMLRPVWDFRIKPQDNTRVTDAGPRT